MSTDENTPEIDAQPPAATPRAGRRGAPPPKPKPAGMQALEQALSRAGKELKDILWTRP
ncbi:hypothetical protein ACIBQ1_47035 [Nonomuraea sp. NPDC050153]|uniref:hypothetical protein n=1 Tax=Nonomuraea sp. NPDC050153 TaxID=3364359 RepID=UPI00379D2D9F